MTERMNIERPRSNVERENLKKQKLLVNIRYWMFVSSFDVGRSMLDVRRSSSTPRMGRRLGLVCLIACLLAAGIGHAAVLLEDEEGERKLQINTALKGTGLFSRAPDDPVRFPDRNAAIGLFRTRFDLKYAHVPLLDANLAYEHRMRGQTQGGAVIGGNILPGGAEAFFRVNQLDRRIYESGESFLWRHEIDRALVSLHPGWGEITMGRQAIGLGRGRLFSAVDMFAPLLPH